MPASSRIRQLVSGRSTLRRTAALLAGRAGPAGPAAIVANALYGGHLTAAPDNTNARVRVDLYWPDIRESVILRVNADGTEHEVRGGDPATMCTAWARWDYECPLDQDVTYKATSDERPGSVTTTGSVTITSNGRHWLKSVARPHLNMQVTIRQRPVKQQSARRGRVDPPLRPDPIFVYQVRAKDKGAAALYAVDQATETAIRAMLADGGPLLLQEPGIAGGESLYLMVDTVSYNPIARITTDLQREIVLPFDGMGRPDGTAEGGPGDKYSDQSAQFATYGHATAAGLTYLEMSMIA